LRQIARAAGEGTAAKNKAALGHKGSKSLREKSIRKTQCCQRNQAEKRDASLSPEGSSDYGSLI